MSTARSAVLALLTGLMLAGCAAFDARPRSGVAPVQAAQGIPAEQRLDVVVHVLDPGIPAALAADEQALTNRRIFPDIRRAEARYMAVMLRNTLEGTSQWGAVRVAPKDTQFVDVTVSGRIVESSGARLVLVVSAQDATGRVWLDEKRYVGEPDPGSYARDAAPDVRDPFQDLYSRIANDLLTARGKLDAARLREIRQVTELLFAADLAPQSSSGYLSRDDASRQPLLARTGDPGPRSASVIGGTSRTDSISVTRLPADNDPLVQRVQRIREHDSKMIDTLDSYYTGFHEQMQPSYRAFRSNFHEIEMDERARRTGPRPAPTDFSTTIPNTTQIPHDARYMRTYFERVAAMRARALAFVTQIRSFQAKAGAQVTDVEAQRQMLDRTAEETYSELRWLLGEYEDEEPAPASQ